MTAIGIFGGTFDPIHYGHLRMAEELRVALGLEQVRFLPSGRPPHRDSTYSSAEDRAEMANRAIAGNPAFVLDTRELQRQGPSYTVDTLHDLRRELGPTASLILLTGSDAFLGLPTWHRWRELLSLAHIVVAWRPGAELHEDALAPELRELWLQHKTDRVEEVHNAPAGKMLWHPITALDIASSKIRDAYAHNFSTRYLLPETVREYIASHHLYARGAT